MTYSIVARDPATGQFGIAVQSHFFAVGAHVPRARAGVGIVASQADARAAYGFEGISLMSEGVTAADALTSSMALDDRPEVRQVVMMDADGHAAVHTGAGCWNYAAHFSQNAVSAQSNLVTSTAIPEAMVDAFLGASGPFPMRLLAALYAAESLGGDLRGRQSAGLLVVGAQKVEDDEDGVILDLRVDDAAEPLKQLHRTVEIALAFEPMWDAIRGPACRGASAPTPEQSDQAIKVLTDAQEIYGPGNREPDFWRSVSLFRADRRTEALCLIGEISESNPGWRVLFDDVISRWPIPVAATK